jgi:hypothetical protein
MYNRSADDNVIIAIPGCGQLLAAGGTPEQSKKMNYAQELYYTISTTSHSHALVMLYLVAAGLTR